MGLLSGFLGAVSLRVRKSAYEPTAGPNEVDVWEGKAAIVQMPYERVVVPFFQLFPDGPPAGVTASELTFDQLRMHVRSMRSEEELEEVTIESGWFRFDPKQGWSAPFASLAELTAHVEEEEADAAEWHVDPPDEDHGELTEYEPPGGSPD